ncbi:hypothetical protein M0R45_015951 [Rubus argutus]|uniref:Uncharacterized protein n=1 Tax=Rubus argutus TaxID=59490 RepID=A0AAW1XR86_RUBAR
MSCPVLSVLINTIASVPAAQKPEASPSPSRRHPQSKPSRCSFPPAPSCSARTSLCPELTRPSSRQGEPVLDPVQPVATLSARPLAIATSFITQPVAIMPPNKLPCHLLRRRFAQSTPSCDAVAVPSSLPSSILSSPYRLPRVLLRRRPAGKAQAAPLSSWSPPHQFVAS